MTISVLVRLVAEALATGEVAGQAVSIATGQEAIFRNADELLEFIRAHQPVDAAPTAGRRRQGQAATRRS